MTKACDVVESLYALARRGDHKSVRELVADDARWEPAAKARWNPCRNGDQIVRTLLWRAGPANRLRPAETIDLGPRAMLRLRGKRTHRLGASGFWAPRLYQVVDVRDGKIVLMQDYAKREEALAAAGLQP
jgi:ketosteroid isomerase-like protein